MISDTKLVRWLLGYLTRHPGLFASSFLLYPLNTLCLIVPPYVVRHLLDEVLPAHDARALTLYCGVYLAALLGEYATGFASQFAMGVLGQRAMRSLRTELFAYVLRCDAQFYDRQPIGRTLTRLTTDVEALAEVFAMGAVSIVGDCITIAAVVGMMLWLDVRLTLWAFLVVPPLVILVWVFRVYARRAFRLIRLHIARINTFLAEHLSGMSIVQVMRQEERTAREFFARNDDYRRANRSAILFDATLYSVVEAIGTCAVAAVIWFSATNLTVGAVGAGTLVAFIHYIRQFFEPIRDLSTRYTLIQSGLAAAERCHELLQEPIGVTSSSTRQATLTRSLSFEHVWFAYRDEHWVLRDFCLDIERGEKLAIVGATGSGKSTLTRLLGRSYDVQKGRVLLDGEDVRALDLDSVRKLYAVVLQDVFLFSGTLLDNLLVTPNVTRERALWALEAVQALPVLERLGHGTSVAIKEHGLNLSEGERQLFAFARALALNPQVLVLDEATSHIDSDTESRLQHALSLLLAERTAIIVAHRLSTIRKADRIVVMHQGQIVEQGSHEALLRQGGHYAELLDAEIA